MIVHIMDQPEVEKGAGPIGVIVVPTRELAEQIHKETRKFSKAYQLRVAAAFGGLSKFEQFKDLKNGSEVASKLTGHHFWYKVVHALIIMQGMVCSLVCIHVSPDSPCSGFVYLVRAVYCISGSRHRMRYYCDSLSAVCRLLCARRGA